MKARRVNLMPLAITAAMIAPQAIALYAFTAAASPDDTRAIVHVLNRIGFGPRPGDVEKVAQVGLKQYIEQQLNPQSVPDTAMSGRLEGLESINLSIREINERYERPQQEMRRLRQQQQLANGNGNNPPNPQEMRRLMQANGGPQAGDVLADLSQHKLLRALYSERQLQEVLTDFWFNHFNVDARKGRTRFLITEYERESIRPHVLGKFRDLLEASAKGPAMLFYLDNWMSIDPNGPNLRARPQPGFQGRPMARGGRGRIQIQMPPRPPQQQANNPRRGLNENYGRELMELHTLGVDGGYTQKDVTEVARAFTGWTIAGPRQGGAGFFFDAVSHDAREKVVLGHRIKAGGGMSDGEQVLDILASHPSTARFITTKLARRFVSDEPPQALVDRLAAKFTATGGDLREVMRALLTSPEFLSPSSYRAKVKTPLEFVVSAVRATGANLTDVRPLVRALQQMGMPLYQCSPPTGYKDTADAWTNTGALVNRMNFATQLATGRQFGFAMPMQDRESLIAAVLGTDVSDTTKATIARATAAPQTVALTFGSPEFQRR
jgi:uncharacterized protein (DUF1800 family)